MCDNGKKDNFPSLGCLGSWTFITGIIPTIIWIVWLIQGRPDNWCGKFCMFQLKAFAVVFGLVILVSLIAGIFSQETDGKSSEETKDNDDDKH